MSSTDDVVVGVDIGGTNLRMGIIDRSQKLSDFTMASSRKKLVGSKSAALLVEHVADYIERTGIRPRPC